MIYIKNTQRSIPLDKVHIQAVIAQLLTLIKYPDFDISIWFTTEKTMQKYNSQFRGINKSTDVLSFPYHADLTPGKRIVTATIDDKNLGDILVAPTYIQKQCKELNQSFDDRLHMLLIHSLYHLLGYDHISDADYAIMKRKEQSLLKKLQKNIIK